MKITAISDLHGHYPELPEGDLLIIAGDLIARHNEAEFFECFNWIHEQRYSKKILIAGNHDQQMQDENYQGPQGIMIGSFEYLCDSGTEFDGLKIWGSPWTLTFPEINPKCTAFTGTEKDLAEKYALIPDDTDILITHGPPYGIMDKTVRGEHVGSKELLKAVMHVKPSFHVFGHVHEGYGKEIITYSYGKLIGQKEMIFLNCSHVDEHYRPVNGYVEITI